jgi:predicted nucleotidyltransferase
MNYNELEATLKSHGSKFVFNQFLMNEDVYVLRESHKEDAIRVYHDIKVATGDALGVPVKNVAIVGSAKTGYSLTPGRNYSPFGGESDLDLVIVSDSLFRELWESYLDYVNSSTGQPYASVAKNVFRHFISIKAEEVRGDQLEYFSSWINRVDRLRQTFQLRFKLPSEINYRVYDAWRYVEQYHVAGLNALIGSK